jgi:hypothetical protein
MVKKATLERDGWSLTAEEQAFLRRARAKFASNADWLEFEDFAFGSRSPLFASKRSHHDVLQHPLYLALKDMWLELGLRQGRIAATERGGSYASRGKARGRG